MGLMVCECGEACKVNSGIQRPGQHPHGRFIVQQCCNRKSLIVGNAWLALSHLSSLEVRCTRSPNCRNDARSRWTHVW